MTLALSPRPPATAPLDLLADFHGRVRNWSDAGSVATAAADALRAASPHATITIHRFDADAQCLLVLASRPSDRGGPPVGSRILLGEGLVSQVVRQGEIRKLVNSYAEPDFVRVLPGETRSELAVPIRAGTSIQGVIHLEYASPHRPSQLDEELSAWLAMQLAVVFAATGSGLAAPGRDDGQAERLAALASHLAQSADLEGVLQRVAETALCVVPGACAAVLLRHESRQMLEVAAVHGEPLVVGGELIPLDRSVPGQVAYDIRPRACPTLGADRDSFSPHDGERGIRSALMVPLSAAGKAYGVLAVLNGAEEGLGAEAVDGLQKVANQAAAIEAMRSLGPLRQRLSDGSLIAEVGRAVTGTLGLDEVLAVVVRAAEMLVSGRCAAVGLLDAGGTSLHLAATSGSLFRQQGTQVPLHGSVMGRAVLRDEPVLCASLDAEPERAEAEAGLGPAVVIPMESGTRVHGALLVARGPDAAEPAEGDVDALRKLAAYASIAIENARLYREQTELSQRLKAQADELERAYAELRTSQERLLVSEKMAALGRITAGIAHEINSPLGGILNCLQMAHTYVGEYQASIGDPDVGPEDHEAIARDLGEALTLAEHSTRKVAQFVRTIKGQTRTGEGELRIPFEPAEEIDGVVAVLQHELRSRRVTLHSEVDRAIPLQGDPGKFSLILQNLVKNAIDAYEGKEGEVHLVWRAGEGDSAVLEVRDQGCGIPDSIRGRIFDYLFTTKDIGQGTGLGLSTVHSIVTTHFDGQIDFQSMEGVGTTFCITFPTSAVKD